MKKVTRKAKEPVADPPARESAPVKLGRGKYPRNQMRKPHETRSVNPLFDLPGDLQMKLFGWMRKIHHSDVILHMLAEEGVTGISEPQLADFFDFESRQQIEMRFLNAAREANALIKVVEKGSAPFSPATLAALEQEIFRQIASGEAEPASISKLGLLFLRVRGHLRADEMHILRSEKLRRELQGQVDHALEKLGEEADKQPGTQAALENLRSALADTFTRAAEEEADEKSE